MREIKLRMKVNATAEASRSSVQSIIYIKIGYGRLSPQHIK